MHAQLRTHALSALRPVATKQTCVPANKCASRRPHSSQAQACKHGQKHSQATCSCGWMSGGGAGCAASTRKRSSMAASRALRPSACIEAME